MIVKSPCTTESHLVESTRQSTNDYVSVLHLVNGEHFAGAERVQDLLALALPEFGYQADFACLKPGKFSEVRKSKSPMFELNMRNSFDLFVTNEVVRIVNEGSYSLIHAHTPRTLLIGSFAARRLKIPLIYHVHSPVGRDSTRKIRNRINTWVETHCLKSVEAMICVSGSLANYMQSIGHDSQKLHVVRNGVPIASEKLERNPPNGQWTLGTMALFRPRKGIECLLQAIALLNARNIDVRLRAVGRFETREYEADVLRLVDELGIKDRITWTGFQSNINPELQQMDLFVLPSLFGEGLPMVVLEAMAQGVPVIASDVEGIPEAVRNGVDGLIFEPGSAEDLADKISDIHGDSKSWSAFSKNSILRQRNDLSDSSMARGVAAVYDRLTQHA